MKAILIKEVEIVADNYRQGCTLDYMNMSNRITRIRLLGPSSVTLMNLLINLGF